MSFDVGSITAYLTLDKSKWNDSVKTMDKQIKNVGKKMAVAGAVISAGFVAAISQTMKFNKEMANVATLIPNSTERVNELKESLRTMGEQVGKSTSDLSAGLYETISAFGDTSDTVKILDINARAAAAGMSTTLEAIKLTSAATKGFGDSSAAAIQNTADLAFMTVKLGQTTFPELAASIGRLSLLQQR